MAICRADIGMWAPFAVLVAMTACGDAGGDGTGGSEGESGTTQGDTMGPPPAPAGPMPLRRLNQAEFNNTVRDLLRDDTRPADDFTPDSPGESGFALAPVVTEVPARDLMRAAEALALKAVADLGALVPCDLAGDELGCVQEFTASFTRRAFRRPVEAEEVTELVDLFKHARTELALGVPDSMSILLQAILLSPRFLYHWQLGDAAPTVEDGMIALTDHELASRLSYFLWATMPDDALFAAADAGELRDPAGFEREVRRLIADPRARDAVASFHLQWLNLISIVNLERDASFFPQYGLDGMKDAMLEQLSTFVNHVVFDADAGLQLLLTADYTFMDVRLGNVIYFVPGLGPEMTQVDLDPEKPRPGLLGLPIFTATHAFFNTTSPVKRGKAIRERMLCETIPSPPANVNTTPPMADFDATTRELYDQILENKDCAGCHALMNPLGYAFESLDQMGRWRPSEFGKLIDSSGYVAGMAGEPTFADIGGLADILADSDQVRHCYTLHWLRYALQRREIDIDADAIDGLYAGFEASDYNIRELIIAVALSPAFRAREPAEGEEVAP